MLDSFFVALNAVMPFFIYLLFGYGVRRIGLVDENFLKRFNQMVFKTFYPIMMFYNIYNNESGIHLNGLLVIVAVSSILVTVTVSVLTVPRLVDGNKRQGVIIQAIYRSNFVLFAAPLVINVYGDEGKAISAMLIAIVVPIYNVIAVIVLEYFGNGGGKTSFSQLFRGVATNPLILGAIVGFIFYIPGIQLPACIEKPVSEFATLTTPLALFILGGTLHFDSLVHNMKYIASTLFVKLLILPTIVLAVCLACGFAPVERFLVFCMYATPVAAASYPMAQNMGCDGDLAGELVVVSTTVSVITIFLWIFFMNSVGMI